MCIFTGKSHFSWKSCIFVKKSRFLAETFVGPISGSQKGNIFSSSVPNWKWKKKKQRPYFSKAGCENFFISFITPFWSKWPEWAQNGQNITLTPGGLNIQLKEKSTKNIFFCQIMMQLFLFYAFFPSLHISATSDESNFFTVFAPHLHQISTKLSLIFTKLSVLVPDGHLDHQRHAGLQNLGLVKNIKVTKEGILSWL